MALGESAVVVGGQFNQGEQISVHVSCRVRFVFMYICMYVCMHVYIFMYASGFFSGGLLFERWQRSKQLCPWRQLLRGRTTNNFFNLIT